jgi:hypothetical protein
VLAVTEAAHRRLHHAIGWLDEHVIRLIGRFADAMTVDERSCAASPSRWSRSSTPTTPTRSSARSSGPARLRLEPNAAQRAVLGQLQVVVGIVGAWARHEARAALEGRLPGLARIEEVLRRRRAVQGDGEELLAGLLGLDLRPDRRDRRRALRRDRDRRARHRGLERRSHTRRTCPTRPSSPTRAAGSHAASTRSTCPTTSRRCSGDSVLPRPRRAQRSALRARRTRMTLRVPERSPCATVPRPDEACAHRAGVSRNARIASTRGTPVDGLWNRATTRSPRDLPCADSAGVPREPHPTHRPVLHSTSTPGTPVVHRRCGELARDSGLKRRRFPPVEVPRGPGRIPRGRGCAPDPLGILRVRGHALGVRRTCASGRSTVHRAFTRPTPPAPYPRPDAIASIARGTEGEA